MAKASGAVAELAAFLSGERVDLRKTLRSLPDDIDPRIPALAVLRFVDNTFYLGRNCKGLPARVVREILAHDTPGATHLFLRLAVREASLEDDWRRALQALLDLDTTYAWGSKQRRAKIRGLAEDPHVLAAIQGTVANCTAKLPLDMLAVLVADGSETSADALITQLDSPAYGEHRTDRLRRLRVHAKKTPFLDALFAELDAEVKDRASISPARALGPIIGIGDIDPLWLDVSLTGHTKAKYRIGARVHVDSRRPVWFSVTVSGREYTQFDASGAFTDNLEIGRCDPADLPGWLATTAGRLGLTSRGGAAWSVEYVRSALRGAKRDRIGAWLLGG